MENNQLQSANGSPVSGKPVTEGPASDKPNRSVVGVIDQSLVALIDRVLDVESAVRESTAQLKMMESQLVQVREIPKKTEAVEKQVAAAADRVEQCVKAFNRLWERVDTFEKSVISKLTERMDAMELGMKVVAAKPAEWGAAMDGLQLQLQKHAELFERPQVKKVHHRHYLNWYIWIVLGLLVACAGMTWLWQDAAKDATVKAGNDLLWRGAWQIPDSTIHDELSGLKDRYDTSSEQFERQVLQDEAHDEQLTQKLKEENIKRWEAEQAQQEAEQAQHEADELQKQRKKR